MRGKGHPLRSTTFSTLAMFFGACALVAVLAIHLEGPALSETQNRCLLATVVLLQVGLAFESLRESLSREGDPFCPRCFAQFVILAYSLGTPLLAVFDNSNRVLLGLFVAGDFSWKDITGTSLLFLLMQTGLYVGTRVRVRPLSLSKSGFKGRQLTQLSWLLFSLALVYYGYTFQQMGWHETSYVDVYAQMQTESAQNPLLSYLSFFSLLPLCSIICASIKEKRNVSVVLVLVALGALTFVKPSRGIVFSTLIVLAFARHYYIRKLSLRQMIVGVVALSLLSIGMVGLRSAGGVGRIVKSHEELTFVGEGDIIYDNTYKVFQNTLSTGDYKYGSTLLDGLLSAVPSYILPFDRGPSPMMWFRNAFFSTKVTEQAGGRMFSIVAEAFMNFGYFGPLIIGFLYGLFLNVLYVSAMTSLRPQKLISLAAILYYYFASQMYYFMRGDFSSFVIRTAGFVAVPLIVMIPIMCVIRIRKEHGGSPLAERIAVRQWL